MPCLHQRQPRISARNIRGRTRLFPCFMSHADLSGIEETVAVLPAVAAGGDEDELRQAVALCRAQLERLRTTELPIWQNVF